MIRKFMTTLLCLLLAFALPMTAVADTQHTFTVIPGDDMAAQAPIKDLFDVLALKLTLGEEAGAFSISLQDKDVLTIALNADVTGLYALSNILSDDVLYVTWDDAFAFITEMMKSQMSAEEAAEMEAAMLQSKQSIVAMLAQGGVTVEPTVLTAEEQMAQLEQMFADDPAMLAYVKNVMSKTVVEEGEFAAEGRDAADCKTTVVITGEDMLPVLESNYARDMLAQQILAENPGMTETEQAKAVDEMVAEAKEVFENSEITAEAVVYTAGEDKLPVAIDMTMNMVMREEADEEPEIATMTMTYARLTDETGVQHNGELVMQVEDETIEMSGRLHTDHDGVANGLFGVLADGGLLSVAYHGANDALTADALNPDGMRVHTVDMYFRDGATAVVEPAAAERPMIGFQLVSGEVEEGLLTAIEAATPETAVNVLELSPAEMEKLGEEISGRAQQVLFGAMAALPSSVLQMIIGQ